MFIVLPQVVSRFHSNTQILQILLSYSQILDFSLNIYNETKDEISTKDRIENQTKRRL